MMRSKKKFSLGLWLGLFSFLTFFIGSSTEANLKAEEEPTLSWDAYIPPAEINDIAFEGDYVWAATVNGVVRWNRNDGSFITLDMTDGLIDNQVWSVAVDSSGTKWFGTQNGLSKFDNVSWTSYLEGDGLPDNWVTEIAIHSTGSLLLGTGDGVSVFDGNNFSRLLNDGVSYASPGLETIDTIVEDNDGNIWISSKNVAASYMVSVDGIWTMYTNSDTGPGGSEVSDIKVSGTGDVWFAMDSHYQNRVGRFSGDDWNSFAVEDGLYHKNAKSIAVDNDGHVWAGFDNYSNSLAKFDGSAWTNVDLKETLGIPSYFAVTKIEADQSGQLWFVARNHLFTFDGTDWHIYLAGLPIQSLLPGPVIEYTADDTVWFSVYRTGAVRYDGTSWNMVTTTDGLAGDYIKDIESDDAGNTWFATWSEDTLLGNGVSRFDGTNWQTFTQSNGLVNNDVVQIAVDQNGKVWFSTWNGLSAFDGDSWETYTTANGLENNRLDALEISGTDVWLGYYGAYGISHFDGSSWKTYTTEDGLSSDRIYAIDFDELGNPWVATNVSVSHLDSGVWTNYPFPEGISNGYVRDLVVDVQGGVWISIYDQNTYWSGISRWFEGEWTNYTTDTVNSLLSNEANHFAPNKTRDVIWFNQSYKGVMRVELVNADIPGVTITESASSTAATEGGATDSYEVVLATQPIANVDVVITLDAQIDLGNGAGNPVTLNFTTSDWDSAQTVTITAVNDDIDEPNHNSIITHTATSSDADYEGISIANVTAMVTDNDEAGVLITESDGETKVGENGTADVVKVVLESEPTANVEVMITPDAQIDLGNGAGSPVVLTFIPSNWKVVQMVTVTAVDDNRTEGNHTSVIHYTVSSSDTFYDGISASDTTIDIIDNDNEDTTFYIFLPMVIK